MHVIPHNFQSYSGLEETAGMTVIMPDNNPLGIIPDKGYEGNMQCVIEQRDDKGISPF